MYSCQDTRLLGFSPSDVSTPKPLWPAFNPASLSGTGGYLGNKQAQSLVEQLVC